MTLISDAINSLSSMIYTLSIKLYLSTFEIVIINFNNQKILEKKNKYAKGQTHWTMFNNEE